MMLLKLITAPQSITGRATQPCFVALVVALSVATGAIASSPNPPAKPQPSHLTLAPGFSPDPQITTGLSGGDRATPDCGYVNPLDRPNQVVTLTQPFTFLQASVQAEGDVTLLIETPSGRLICSDDVNGLMPEISGEAPAGTYKIWVGDYGSTAASKAVNGASGYAYRLTLTEKRPSP